MAGTVQTQRLVGDGAEVSGQIRCADDGAGGVEVDRVDRAYQVVQQHLETYLQDWVEQAKLLPKHLTY